MDGDLRSDVPPSLLLMKGPPGSGKSTLARELGRRLHWPVIDKDDVRDLLPDAIGGISYEAMLAVARRQLQLGLSVIADSPLGYGESYRRAVSMAAECGARVAVIECALHLAKHLVHGTLYATTHMSAHLDARRPGDRPMCADTGTGLRMVRLS